MKAVPSTNFPLPTSRTAGEVAHARPSAFSGATFGDLLAELKLTGPPTHRSQASPEQMLKQPPLSAKDRRVAELRQEYVADVTQEADKLSRARHEVRDGSLAPIGQDTEFASRAEFHSEIEEIDDEYDHSVNGNRPMMASEPTQGQPVLARRTNEFVLRASLIRHDSRPADSATNVPVISAAFSGRAGQGQVGGSPIDAASQVARVLTMNPTGKGEAALPAGASAVAAEARPGTYASKRADTQKAPLSSDPPRSQSETRTGSQVSKFEQLVRAVRASSGRQSTARVLLDPPDLGRMHVRVSVAGDRVEIGVETENETARQLIVGRAQKLKNILEQRGMAVERFDVSMHRGGLFEPQIAVLPNPWTDGRDQRATRTRKVAEEQRARDSESLDLKSGLPVHRPGKSLEVEV